jgi:hypothetical protein
MYSPNIHANIILTLLLLDVFSDLVQCTKEPNVSIPVLANLLLERTQNEKWVVVFKALITIHNLMNYGNEVSKIGPSILFGPALHS